MSLNGLNLLDLAPDDEGSRDLEEVKYEMQQILVCHEVETRQREIKFYRDAIPSLHQKTYKEHQIQQLFLRIIEIASLDPQSEEREDKLSLHYLSLGGWRLSIFWNLTALEALDGVSEGFLKRNPRKAVLYYQIRAFAWLGLSQFDGAEIASRKALDIIDNIKEPMQAERDTSNFLRAVILVKREGNLQTKKNIMEALFFKSLVSSELDLNDPVINNYRSTFDNISDADNLIQVEHKERRKLRMLSRDEAMAKINLLGIWLQFSIFSIIGLFIWICVEFGPTVEGGWAEVFGKTITVVSAAMFITMIMAGFRSCCTRPLSREAPDIKLLREA